MAADASAQITELKVDDHACLTFGEAEELFDLTAAYVRDGLAGGSKVMWLGDDGQGPTVAELARRGIAVRSAMAAGHMAAAGCEGRLLSGQVFLTGAGLDALDIPIGLAPRALRDIQAGQATAGSPCPTPTSRSAPPPAACSDCCGCASGTPNASGDHR